MASEVPPEIITNILYRLPAKSLGRFRCVSKHWLSLISEPQFIKTHQHSHNRSHVIFVCNRHPLYSLPIHHHEADAVLEPTKIRFKTNHTNLTFHGSCNGLVLVSGHHLMSVYLFILNPTTGEFVKSQHPIMRTMNDLLEMEIMYGFGYDTVTDDYKVVSISCFHDSYLIPVDKTSIHVYSLRTNTWRRVTDSPYDHSYVNSVPGVFVNGFLHWVAANKGSGHLPVIVAFSLADEKFSELPLPNLLRDVYIMYTNDCKLVVLDEKLADFLKDEVWLMNEYGVRESWTKIIVPRIHEVPMVEPMIFHNNGKILFVKHDQMLTYDIEERSICKSGNVSLNLRGLKVRGSYIESLVSPKFNWSK